MSENPTSTKGRHAYPAAGPTVQQYRRSGGSVVARLVLGLAVVSAAVIGLVVWRSWLVGVTAADAWDARAQAWWTGGRGVAWTDAAQAGTWMSGAIATACVTVLAVLVLRLWLGRWYESGVLVVAVGGAALCFAVLAEVVVGSHLVVPHLDASHLVLPHLDAAPPSTGYPSGHVGVAVALYGCLAVLVRRSARSRLVRVVVPVMLWLVPLAVAASRVLRGEDLTTEVVLGALAGLGWLAVVLGALMPRIVRIPEPRRAGGVPPQEETVDLRSREGLGTAR